MAPRLFLCVSLPPVSCAPLHSLQFYLSCSYSLHIVGGKHALFASALDTAKHPTLVYLLHVQDDISIRKRHLILISCSVVIDGFVALLKNTTIHVC